VTGPVEEGHWEGELKGLIERHAQETGSRKAADILQHWDTERGNFMQICPLEMLDKLPHPLATEAAAMPAE
jgi:glutamate synthase (NADPH) large chain